MNTPHDRSTGHDGGSGDRAQGYGAADASGGDQDVTEQLKSEGKEQLDQYRDVAADKLDTLADSVKAAASQLEVDDVGHLSGHIADMADSMSQLSDGLRNKSVDEILHDVRQVARDNPTLFLAGSIAIGFGLTRFARASAPTNDKGSSDKARSDEASHDKRSSASSVSGQQRTSGRSSTGSRRSDADRAASQGQHQSTGTRGSHDASSNIAGTVEHPVISASSATSSEARAADTRGGLAGNTKSGSDTGALAGNSGPNTINDASLGTGAGSGSTGSGPHDAGGGSAAALGTRTAAPDATHQTGSTYETGADQSNGRKPS